MANSSLVLLFACGQPLFASKQSIIKTKTKGYLYVSLLVHGGILSRPAADRNTYDKINQGFSKNNSVINSDTNCQVGNLHQ